MHAAPASRAHHLHHDAPPASDLNHLHQRCNTCIKPASPASSLHHLHQTCITCIKPASPSSDLHHLHHACINCITRASTASRVHHAAASRLCPPFPPHGHMRAPTRHTHNHHGGAAAQQPPVARRREAARATYPRQRRRRMVPYPYRPHRPVLFGRQRRSRPSHLSEGSSRAYTARHARKVTTPAAAAAPAPKPQPRRSCVSREERRSLSSWAIRRAHQRSRAPAEPPHGTPAATHHAPPYTRGNPKPPFLSDHYGISSTGTGGAHARRPSTDTTPRPQLRQEANLTPPWHPARAPCSRRARTPHATRARRRESRNTHAAATAAAATGQHRTRPRRPARPALFSQFA